MSLTIGVVLSLCGVFFLSVYRVIRFVFLRGVATPIHMVTMPKTLVITALLPLRSPTDAPKQAFLNKTAMTNPNSLFPVEGARARPNAKQHSA